MGKFKQEEKLMEIIQKMQPLEFMGLAQILDVPLYKSDESPKEFNDLLLDIFNAFQKLNRFQKRIFLKNLQNDTPYQKTQLDVIMDKVAKLKAAESSGECKTDSGDTVSGESECQ